MILLAGLSPAWQETRTFQDLRLGEVNRASEVHRCASGKVINAARAAHLLARFSGTGGPVRALTIVGGLTGEAVARGLRAEGIEAVLVPCATPTRVCMTVIDSGGSITELVENAGEVTAAELDAFRSSFRREAEGAAAVVLTGSPPGGASADYYRSLIEGIRAPVVLDVRGPDLLETLPLLPFLVKPNREELARTVGRPIRGEADLRSAMIEIARRGARWVLVTQGKEPAWAHGEGKFHRFRTPRVDTVNPIGSGDALAGGLAHAIACGAGPIEAIRTGIACGAANAATLLPGHIDPARVERLRAEVSVESVESD